MVSCASCLRTSIDTVDTHPLASGSMLILDLTQRPSHLVADCRLGCASLLSTPVCGQSPLASTLEFAATGDALQCLWAILLHGCCSSRQGTSAFQCAADDNSGQQVWWLTPVPGALNTYNVQNDGKLTSIPSCPNNYLSAAPCGVDDVTLGPQVSLSAAAQLCSECINRVPCCSKISCRQNMQRQAGRILELVVLPRLT